MAIIADYINFKKYVSSYLKFQLMIKFRLCEGGELLDRILSK